MDIHLLGYTLSNKDRFLSGYIGVKLRENSFRQGQKAASSNDEQEVHLILRLNSIRSIFASELNYSSGEIYVPFIFEVKRVFDLSRNP